MSRRVRRRYPDVLLEVRNSVCVFSSRVERRAKRENRIPKSRINFPRGGKMCDCVVPLPFSPSEFSQPKLGGRIVWIDRQLEREFFFRFFSSVWQIRLRKGRPCQAVVDASQLGILFQNLPVNCGGIRPLFL